MSYFLSSITSRFLSFFHWIVFDLPFNCVTVKTIDRYQGLPVSNFIALFKKQFQLKINPVTGNMYTPTIEGFLG